jgi:hypothetical protein
MSQYWKVNDEFAWRAVYWKQQANASTKKNVTARSIIDAGLKSLQTKLRQLQWGRSHWYEENPQNREKATNLSSEYYKKRLQINHLQTWLKWYIKTWCFKPTNRENAENEYILGKFRTQRKNSAYKYRVRIRLHHTFSATVLTNAVLICVNAV